MNSSIGMGRGDSVASGVTGGDPFRQFDELTARAGACTKFGAVVPNPTIMQSDSKWLSCGLCPLRSESYEGQWKPHYRDTVGAVADRLRSRNS
jgi:hypothetical protein